MGMDESSAKNLEKRKEIANERTEKTAAKISDLRKIARTGFFAITPVRNDKTKPQTAAKPMIFLFIITSSLIKD